jgi:hypothetical protein
VPLRSRRVLPDPSSINIEVPGWSTVGHPAKSKLLRVREYPAIGVSVISPYRTLALANAAYFKSPYPPEFQKSMKAVRVTSGEGCSDA